MAYCDDDFAILGDDAQSHPQPPFATHRYVTSKSSTIVHHHLASISSPAKKGAVADDGGVEEHEGYGEAFGQTDVSKCPSAPAFHDHHCFVDTAIPFAPQHPAVEEDDADDEGGNDNNLELKGASISVSHHNLHHQQLAHHLPSKRDDLSDGESPYCYNSSGAANKKPKAMSSSGDYRKDREEWSDTAIGSLLDAYTEKFVQLSRGNLRGRDWEDVATIVSERCNRQKSAKSVEQCKNKIDNLKKRYKVECQRLSSSGLPGSHWTWFKKMEQLIGSSSSSKANLDDDKSVNLGSPATAARQMKRYPVTGPGPVSLNNNSKIKSLPTPRWKRVVLRINGMALSGGTQNVDPKVVMLIAKEIAIASGAGLEVAVVVGGRNYFCGDTWMTTIGIDKSSTFQIGMMASLMNSIMLQASLEKIGIEARIHSTLMLQEIAEPYIRRRAIRHLEKGKVVIFGAGAEAGNSILSTDTAAALRASESMFGDSFVVPLYCQKLDIVHANAVLKGTTSDDFYNCHSRNNNGGAFEHISFREFVSRGFTAVDIAALNICEESHIPIVLFSLLEPGNLTKALCGDQVGIMIDQSGRIN
ncbi:hypothetical protein ZIOFF_055961 [Zingiber officinale]|uniref:UMP kinase n=1 Tax=Zingiber officinale TaxID=94328 RepID=A0A8J5FIC7_ZINOF|nr:hypothetical protein ZIOFF_055961 [Zingiber officinale]